ncbi:MAG: hypothetical protein AAB596_01130 [Patescibacteria group bacterium]
MEKDLIKILKNLKQITADDEYSNRSRYLILSSEINRQTLSENRAISKLTFAEVFNLLTLHKLAAATATIGIFLFIIFISVFYLIGPNQSQLVAEANEVNDSIEIKLDQIKYYIETQPSTNLPAITTMQELLAKAEKDLREAYELSLNPESIKGALEKIKSAEKTLQEINSAVNGANK